jgi:ADP-glucose pyrophosphorylase
VRSIVGSGSRLNRTIMLGSDYYESAASISENESAGNPRIGIGQSARIENAIIDKNARIGKQCDDHTEGKPENVDEARYLHPRRHRDHSQKRRRAARHCDLIGTQTSVRVFGK